MANYVTHYATLGEALEAIENANLPTSESSHKVERGDNPWTGTKTWEEAWKLAFTGWGEVVAKIQAKALSQVRETRRPTPVLGITGTQLDIGRYFSGEPECLLEMVDDTTPSPVIKILVNRATSASVSTERMEALGRNVLVLVESLRLAGVPAEVWVGTYQSSGLSTLDIRVKIQEAGRPLDIARLAYWVAHPAAFRRLFFALMEVERREVRDAIGVHPNGGYGVPKQYSENQADEVTPNGNASDASLEQWVTSVLDRRTAC